MDAKQFQAKCYNLKSQLDTYIDLVKSDVLPVESARVQICKKVNEVFGDSGDSPDAY